MTRSWTSFCSPDERQGSRLMRIPSQEEKVQAILDARAPVAEYLASIGKVDAFESFTRDEICGLIRVAQERSEEHTSELQSRGHLVCRLLLEKKKNIQIFKRSE